MNQVLAITSILIASALPLLGESFTLKSKDGREISVNIIQIYSDAVEATRQDGEQFTIPFEKLDDATVESLKSIAQAEKDAQIAAMKSKMEAEAAELARIPKFPENPKSLEEIPQKIIFKPEDGKEAFIAFEQVKDSFIEPKLLSNKEESGAYLSVSTAFGGGQIMTILSQRVCPENLTFKLITRKDGDTSLVEPISISVPSEIAQPSGNGAVSAGYFSKRLEGDVTEIILYDFQIAR